MTVKAKEYSDAEAVQLAKTKLNLGDISAVKSDLYLPKKVYKAPKLRGEALPRY